MLGSLVAAGTSPLGRATVVSETDLNGKEIVQAQKVLTVSEGKKLIAKGIVQMPLVQGALKDGLVIITRGTTTTYIAKEILKRDIPHGAFTSGVVYPEKRGKRLQRREVLDEIILIDGQQQLDLSLAEALKMLKVGDVVFKGANALNYGEKLAGGLIGSGSSSAGTSGRILPPILGSKAQLVVPVSLEKEVGGNLIEIVRAMQSPTPTLGYGLSMVLYTGIIFTEIEALHTLTGVSALHIASGGIGGAEGSIRLLLRGSTRQVEKALEIIDGIQGEPPFFE